MGGLKRFAKRGGRLVLSTAAFAAVLILPAYAAEPETESVCITCHAELEGELQAPAAEWPNSAHAKAGVMCQDCHGGDPTDMELAMKTKGYQPRPKRTEVAKMCAKCHADPLRMRQYNLRTDQFDLYSGSVHGKKLTENDAESATCVDCHGKHEIRKMDDPLASVNRANVVKTCGKCHSDQKIMEKRKIPFNQYELYKGSVHGQAYFERHDLGVPTCVNCHGNHAIQKPQQMPTRFVCAECHIEQADAYKKSRHWAAAQENGKPLCIHCHGNHAIARPTSEKFNAPGDLNCLSCHPKNSIQMETAVSLNTAITSAKAELDMAENAMKGMEQWSGSGFETSQLKANLAKAKKMYAGMRTAAHALNVVAVKSDGDAVKQISAAVTAEVDRMMRELRIRKIGLAVTWLVAILFSFAVWQRSRYCKRD